jgi:hypothetical protein
VNLEDVFGQPAAGAPQILPRLAALISSPLPRLERLVLQGCRFSRELISWLFDQPIPSNVRQLDLSGGSLADADIPLLEARQRFIGDRLERIDLRRNRFSKLGRERLASFSKNVVIE